MGPTIEPDREHSRSPNDGIHHQQAQSIRTREAGANLLGQGLVAFSAMGAITVEVTRRVAHGTMIA
jgi:hypothetical protein